MIEYFTYTDMSHISITNANGHYVYKIQKLLRLSIAVRVLAIKSTYTSTTVCYRREPRFSLETL